MSARQTGFTLIEALIGAAITAFVLFIALSVARQLADAASRTNARVQGDSAANALAERLANEAANAWAVYVPASDVFGNANGDGHEVAFYSQDGAHRPVAWAYDYDAPTQRVMRYGYAPGVAPTAGEQFAPITSFQASARDVAHLADPLFAGASAPVVHYPFSSSSGAVGGNDIVRLHLSANGVDRTESLASASAPTTFTIVVGYTPVPPTPAPSLTPLPQATLSPTPTP